MGPAERTDLIVDFTQVATGNHVLRNLGPDEPFGGGEPDEDFDTADPNSTGQIMQFHVVPALAADPTTPPGFLKLPSITRLTGGATRSLAMLEKMSEFFDDAPIEARLGTVSGDANAGPATTTAEKWEDPVTTNPTPGATEVWEFYNTTADAHPMHVHEVLFQVVNRQPIVVDEATRNRPGGTELRTHLAAALGERMEGHGHRLSGPGHQAAYAVRQPRAVRLALPHRRT